MNPALVKEAEDAFAAATAALDRAEEAINGLGCQFDDPLVVDVRDTYRRLQRHRQLLEHRYRMAVNARQSPDSV